MAKYYAPNFSGLLPLFDGKSAAGGKLYAYRAGTSIPAPLFNDDGVELGSWVSIDSNGCADFLLDSALSYKLVVKDALGATAGEWDNVKATNAPGGMDNPMENAGDLIVGGTGGTATALPAGTTGQALKIDTDGVPAWLPDEGMQNPMTTEGDLIVGTTDGEPARLPVGAAGEVLTSNGTTWAPAAIPTQTGDHKTAVDGADASPDYLAAKLAAGTGISLTNTGSAVSIAADTQPGDHQLLVSNADAAAGYLGAKLVPGSNITLTPLTDGDGVQTLEIASTGGGGGGSGRHLSWQFRPHAANASVDIHLYTYPDRKTVCVPIVLEGDTTPTAVRIALYSFSDWPLTIKAAVTNWPTPQSSGYASPEIRYYGEATFTSSAQLENDFTYLKNNLFFLDVPLTWKRGTKTFSAGEEAVALISFDKYAVNALASSSTDYAAWCFYSATELNASDTNFVYGTIANLKRQLCVGIIG